MRAGWWVGMKEGGRKRIGELGGRKEKKGRKGGMEGVKRGRRQREKKIHKDINVESWNVVVVKCYLQHANSASPSHKLAGASLWFGHPLS